MLRLLLSKLRWSKPRLPLRTPFQGRRLRDHAAADETTSTKPLSTASVLSTRSRKPRRAPGATAEEAPAAEAAEFAASPEGPPGADAAVVAPELVEVWRPGGRSRSGVRVMIATSIAAISPRPPAPRQVKAKPESAMGVVMAVAGGTISASPGLSRTVRQVRRLRRPQPMARRPALPATTIIATTIAAVRRKASRANSGAAPKDAAMAVVTAETMAVRRMASDMGKAIRHGSASVRSIPIHRSPNWLP